MVSREDIVYVVSADFDGCFATPKGESILEKNAQAITQFKKRISALPAGSVKYGFIGSNRQSMYVDSQNSLQKKTESCFTELPTLFQELGVEFQPLLLADIYAEKQPGYAIQLAEKYQDPRFIERQQQLSDELDALRKKWDVLKVKEQAVSENLRELADTQSRFPELIAQYQGTDDDGIRNQLQEELRGLDVRKGTLLAEQQAISAELEQLGDVNAQCAELEAQQEPNPHWLFDDSKASILYAQMHYVASQHPEQQIIFDFVDDREYIMRSLYHFFTQNPTLMPKNVTLNRYQYGHGQNIKQYNSITGTGPIDLHYSNTVRMMGEQNLGRYKSATDATINAYQPSMAYSVTEAGLQRSHLTETTSYDSYTDTSGAFAETETISDTVEAGMDAQASGFYDFGQSTVDGVSSFGRSQFATDNSEYDWQQSSTSVIAAALDTQASHFGDFGSQSTFGGVSSFGGFGSQSTFGGVSSFSRSQLDTDNSEYDWQQSSIPFIATQEISELPLTNVIPDNTHPRATFASDSRIITEQTFNKNSALHNPTPVENLHIIEPKPILKHKGKTPTSNGNTSPDTDVVAGTTFMPAARTARASEPTIETIPTALKARHDALLAKLYKYATAKDGLTSAKEQAKCQHTHDLHKKLSNMTPDSLGSTMQYVQDKLDSTSNSYSPLLFKAFFSSEAKKMFQEASTLLTLIRTEIGPDFSQFHS